MSTIEELEAQLKATEEDKQYIKWLLRQVEEQRLDSHQNRVNHVREMAKKFVDVLEEKPKPVDLYYTTSDKLTGEDYLFWNRTDLWIEFKFAKI